MQSTRSRWIVALHVGALACVVQVAWAQDASKPEDAPLLAGVGVDWWQSVQADIAQSEYAVTWQDTTPHVDLAGAYQAPNRAQNFRTYFAPDGIRLIPRTTHKDEAPAWKFGLGLTAWGRGGALQPVAPAAPLANGNRVEYQRGDVVEWYVNDTRGLEQGFSIERDPAPDARDTANAFLSLHLAVTGDVAANAVDCAEAVDFLAPGGALAIRLDKLQVLDASGRDLPAWFEVSDELTHAASQSLSIVVDDRGAVYPLTIDPLATSPSWTAEANQAGAHFGQSLATAGDVNGDGYSDVIVGAPGFDNGETDEGAAWLYFGSASGLAAGAPWSAEGNQVGANFGFSVAPAGDVNGDGYSDVIVGAPLYDNFVFAPGGGSWSVDSGHVWVFHGSASGLATNAAWTDWSSQAGGQFGCSVSTAGDVNGDGYSDVIVGARWYDSLAFPTVPNQGRALVYHGSPSGLTAASWSQGLGPANTEFGTSVSTAGDVNGDGFSDVIVGAPYYDNGETDEGGAFVYMGSPGGLATSYAWHAEMNQQYTTLGWSVSTAGDVNGDGYSDVIVGAPGYDNGESNEGLALVYQGSAGGLPAGPAWYAESNQVGAEFGNSVSMSGDVNGDGYAEVIVGAWLHDGGQVDEGWAVMYYGSATGVGPYSTAWQAESNQAYSHFGLSVATAGDVNGDGYSDVIVGAHDYNGGQQYEGRAYVYHGSAGGLAANAGWTGASNQAYALFGYSVSTAGDVNGDGYSDVIVGVPQYDSGEVDEGRAYVYHGSAIGLWMSAAWTAESNQAGALFGHSVSTSGDVNGDGYSDVIVGAPYYEYSLPSGSGRAFVYQGSASGLSTSAAWIAGSAYPNQDFGYSVSTAGDVNGDGYSDVIVGARSASFFGNSNAGCARVYHGSLSGLSTNADWTDTGTFLQWFGYSVSTAGDVNGDGYSDVIVGAPYSYSGPWATDQGRAFVYHGSASGLATTGGTMLQGQPNPLALSDFFGSAVSTAGDVNGDGYSDVIIGSRWWSNGESDEGRAFVYQGSASGLGTSAAWTAESNQDGANFGWSVSMAGDVNGDGYSDVIVGAPYYDATGTNNGRAFVYHGSASGLAANADWTAESDQAGANFGYSVSTAGDVRGDGYSDVIVGAPEAYFGPAYEGRAFVYNGNGGPGMPVRLRQRRTNDSAPIASLGVAHNGFFLAKFVLRSPFGRGDGRFLFENRPLGTPFTGQVGGPLNPPVVDMGTGGVDMNLFVSLPFNHPWSPMKAYHWQVRVVHSPVTTPWLPAGPWFTPSANCATETDLRTPPPTCGQVVDFCTAGTTSSGCTALISGTGIPRANEGSGFTISAANVEGGQNGILFYGVSGSKVDPWGTGTSILCVKGPLERMGVQLTGGTAGACNGALSIDWNQYIVTHPNAVGAPFAGGETVWAQAWFRDPPSPKTTSLSNGLQFTVCP